MLREEGALDDVFDVMSVLIIKGNYPFVWTANICTDITLAFSQPPALMVGSRPSSRRRGLNNTYFRLQFVFFQLVGIKAVERARCKSSKERWRKPDCIWRFEKPTLKYRQALILRTRSPEGFKYRFTGRQNTTLYQGDSSNIF